MSSDHVARFQNLEQNQGSSLRGFDKQYITPITDHQSPAPGDAALKLVQVQKQNDKSKGSTKNRVKETWVATYCKQTSVL